MLHLKPNALLYLPRFFPSEKKKKKTSGLRKQSCFFWDTDQWSLDYLLQISFDL